MKQIGLALLNYQQDQGRFPPAVVYEPGGRPLYSWRVLLLPYLEGQKALHGEFRLDEPWDSESNRRLLARMPREYDHPSAEGGRDLGLTHFQIFNGPGTAFESRRGEPPDGITDATNSTLLVVEAREPVPWTRPVDLPYLDVGQIPTLGTVSRARSRPFDAGENFGFLALFADGSVRFLKKALPEATLRKLITRAGGDPVNSDEF